MSFSTIFQSYHGNQVTFSCVLWLCHTSSPHNILSEQLAAFSHKLLAHGEIQIMLVTVNFVKRRNKCWLSWVSNSQSLDWQPASLSTELPGLSCFIYQPDNWNCNKNYCFYEIKVLVLRYFVFRFIWKMQLTVYFKVLNIGFQYFYWTITIMRVYQ